MYAYIYIYIILLYIHHFNQFNHRYQQQTCQKVDPRPDTMAFTSSSVGCEVPHCVRTYCSFASSSVSTSGVGGWEMENMCEPIVNHASMSTLCLYIYIIYIYIYTLYFGCNILKDQPHPMFQLCDTFYIHSVYIR